MEKHTSQNKSGQVATIDERSIPFKPRAALLLDVLPASAPKAAGIKTQPDSDDSPEEMLQNLLMRTETSAQKTQTSRMKWQLATLVLAMLLAPAIAVTTWLQIETGSTGTLRASLEMENQSLKEQINTAGLQINGLKGELDTQLNRNLELAGDIAKLKSPRQPSSPAPVAPLAGPQKSISAPQITSTPPATTRQSPDSSRIEAIRNGKYPSGATKDELKAVLGEPDRIYKSARYEQWVYFGRKTARFWFIGNWLVQAEN